MKLKTKNKMDTSKLYIKMCEKAQEIQDLVELKSGESGALDDGDYYAVKGNFEIGCIGFHPSSTTCYWLNENEFWLPRQDQLQDMLNGSIFEKLNKFYQFICPPVLKINPIINKEVLEDFTESWRKIISETNLSPKSIISSEESDIEFINVGTETYSSIEQLWLAFVMKENYNKIWNYEREEWQLK